MFEMFCKTLFVLCILFTISYSWVIEGFAPQLPEHQIERNHEANFFRQRLLSAFRSIDPHVSESTLNRFTRFVRENEK